MSEKLAVTLSPATLADAPRMGEIATRAFDHDTHSQMKIMGQKPGSFAEGMLAGARYWLENPERCVTLKATVASGSEAGGRSQTEIVGWIVWAFRGEGVKLEPPPALVVSDDGDDDKVEELTEKTKRDSNKTGDVDEAVPGAEKVAALEAMTSAHFSEWMDRMMPTGTRCLCGGAIAVDPAYQGRGVGRELIRWGARAADELGVFCWVHSSQGGWSMFEKEGFAVNDKLEFDLDEYAVGPPPADGVFGDREKWGKYTLTYGVRQPVKS